MSLGTYGTTIPININDNDITNLVDIYYCYHESRVYDSLEEELSEEFDEPVEMIHLTVNFLIENNMMLVNENDMARCLFFFI